MAKLETRQQEPTGWLFWGITVAVLLPLCLWGSWHITRESASLLAKVALGGIGAAVSASLVSMAVNKVIETRNARQRRENRKIAKKRR